MILYSICLSLSLLSVRVSSCTPVSANVLLMAEYCSIVYIYHILVCSWMDIYLGCFHVLAVVNSATVNKQVHVSFWIVVLSGYMPKSEIAGWYGDSIFIFRGTSIQYSIVVVPIYILTNSAGGFPFFCTLSSIIVCRLLDDGHFNSCEVILIAVLICISLIITNIEHLLMSFLAVYLSFWRNVFLYLLTIFWLGYLLFLI